jgi:hypothetical protein
MAELTLTTDKRRFYFNWIPDVFFRPRLSFQRIASVSFAIWITPLLVISCLVLINTLAVGRIKSQAVITGELTYPPDYQYYTPEQQAQYMQAAQSTQGPVFIYVLPVIASLLGVWIVWLILGGVLHLVTTLFGGRGSTVMSMNIVAWASLPLALRALIQVIYTLVTKNAISNPGLSGFSPTGDTGLLLFVGQVLRLIDIYIVWQILLLMLGVRTATALSISKSIICVLLAIFVILALQAGFAHLGTLLGNLSITRPFFF